MALVLLGPHGCVDFPVDIPGTVCRQIIGFRLRDDRIRFLVEYLNGRKVSDEVTAHCVDLLRDDELTLSFS